MATPWAALGQDVEVLYVMGCPDMHCANDTFIFQVVEAAKNTDPTIVFIRLDISIKIEGLDWKRISFRVIKLMHDLQMNPAKPATQISGPKEEILWQSIQSK